MSHWSENYVGRPYVEKQFDCGELARTVQREVFGKDVAIPTERRYEELKGRSRFEAMTSQIAEEKDTYARRTETPEEGDGVLLAYRKNYWHIGVYCFVNGEAYVLHAADGKVGMVVMNKIRELAGRGYVVEGYYKWI